jgi:hypothetical protein
MSGKCWAFKAVQRLGASRHSATNAMGPSLQAEGRWWHQLEAAGAKVDGYSFTGFIRSDGRPLKDLNDFALIDPDQWEAKREAIEGAFSFST